MDTILNDKTLLIAEDEHSNYLLLNEYLEPTGAKILWACDGLETLKILESVTPDLVLLDIKMPHLDGYAVISEIRKTNTQLPVIAQTAYTMLGDREKIIEAGCNDYISKPYSNKDLLAIVKKYLSQHTAN